MDEFRDALLRALAKSMGEVGTGAAPQVIAPQTNIEDRLKNIEDRLTAIEAKLSTPDMVLETMKEHFSSGNPQLAAIFAGDREAPGPFDEEDEALADMLRKRKPSAPAAQEGGVPGSQAPSATVQAPVPPGGRIVRLPLGRFRKPQEETFGATITGR